MLKLQPTRQLAWEWYADRMAAAEKFGPDYVREVEAAIGRADLFMLLVRLLRRHDLNKDWLFERCREVQAEPNGYLDLWAREHGKSSIITFGLTIQDILKDPEITVGIFSHTRPVAKAFLRQIKVEFEGNAILKDRYPDVLWAEPRKESPKWSEDDGIIVKRKGNPKEATVEAWGLVDGQPTGRHFRLRVYDDVVTRESVTTPEQIEKTTRAWELSDNLGVQAEQGGVARHIGTRYCTVADTRILMGDWTFKRIADVQVGEEVIGWEQRPQDGKRYLVKTPVVHCGSHEAQPVNKYTFSNGRTVTCTADHRWWRGAQWASAGSSSARAGRSNGNEYSALGLGYHQLKHIRQLTIPMEWDDSRDAAWLAGFFDGEGHVTRNGADQPSGCIVMTQSERNRVVIEQAERCLASLGFESSTIPSKVDCSNPVSHIRIDGGWRARHKFLVQVAPIRNGKIADSLFGQMLTERLKLTAVEDAGSADVFWLQTGTGNYVADGFCSANSLYDTYASMLERGAVKPRLYSATHNSRFDGRPVLFSQAEWERRLTTQSRGIVAAQLLQNPMADDDATFKTEWLRSYELRPRTLNCYLMIDPSRGRSATSDNTAMAVVGIASNGAKFLLDGACHRMTLSQRWQMMRTLFHRWSSMAGVQHIEVGYERFGAQSDDEYFQEQQRLEQRRGIRNAVFQIRELNWPREGGNSKKERVERLEPDFRNGRFFLPAPVLYQGKPSLWKVETDPEAKNYGEVEFREKSGLSKAEAAAVEGGSADLLAKAIIVRDPSLPGPAGMGGRYDLTLRLIEEFKVFPFGAHDDLIDSCSRIYDMDPHPPVPASRRQATEPKVFIDGV